MKGKFTTKDLVLVGLGAALMGVFSQLSIPLPTVPLTLQVFGAILIAILLGAKLGTLAMVIYTLIGAIGIPVFSNFSGGLSVLVGPTGGYIMGFIVLAFLVGLSAQQKNKSVFVIGTYIGLVLQYAIGTIQLKVALNLSLSEAVIAGVYPFIVKDLILVGVAIAVGIQMKKQLRGLLDGNLKA